MDNGQTTIIELIEENIHNLVKVQNSANECLETFFKNEDNYIATVEKLEQYLRDEKDLLLAIQNNLNRLFHCGRFNKFRITHDACSMIRDRYIIRTPLFLNKASKEYQLLKQVLIRLHKHYFLMDGGIGYAFSRVESHMWEIPCFMSDNELIGKLRKQI